MAQLARLYQSEDVDRLILQRFSWMSFSQSLELRPRDRGHHPSVANTYQLYRPLGLGLELLEEPLIIP